MYKVTKSYGPERGFSCAFRQWSSDTDCQFLHGYSLSFKIELESSSLDINNWVYDFGKFSFLDSWLREKFDHTLLVAKNDPELDLIKSLKSSTCANTFVNVITSNFLIFFLILFDKLKLK